MIKNEKNIAWVLKDMGVFLACNNCMQQKLQQEGNIMKKITATTTRSLRTTPSRQTVDGAADFHHGGCGNRETVWWWYCWWKKSCTSLYIYIQIHIPYPSFHKSILISQVQDFFHVIVSGELQCFLLIVHMSGLRMVQWDYNHFLARMASSF